MKSTGYNHHAVGCAAFRETDNFYLTIKWLISSKDYLMKSTGYNHHAVGVVQQNERRLSAYTTADDYWVTKQPND